MSRFKVVTLHVLVCLCSLSVRAKDGEAAVTNLNSTLVHSYFPTTSTSATFHPLNSDVNYSSRTDIQTNTEIRQTSFARTTGKSLILRRVLINVTNHSSDAANDCNSSSPDYNATNCPNVLVINFAFLQKYAGSIGGGSAGVVVFFIAVVCLIRYEIWRRRKEDGYYEELEIMQLEGNEKAVYCVAWSPNGEYIATGSADATLRIWHSKTCKEAHCFAGHFAPVWSLAWGSDNILISCSGGQLAMTGHYAELGGQDIIIKEPDNSVRVWDVHKGVQRVDPLRQADFVRAVAYSPDGQWFASGSDDGAVCLYDAEASEPVHTAEVPCWVYALAFAPDSLLLVAACSDARVRVIDVEAGAVAREYHIHIGRVSLSLSPASPRPGPETASTPIPTRGWRGRPAAAAPPPTQPLPRPFKLAQIFCPAPLACISLSHAATTLCPQ